MPPTNRILCVTPNAALDRTLTVQQRLIVGAVHRTDDALSAAGGKGINVARAARILGAETICAGILAGHTGRLVAELAAHEGLKGEWTWVEGETRVCTIIVDHGGATVINEPGVQVTPADWDRFCADVQAAARHADTICLCGSLPSGVPGYAYGDLIPELKQTGKTIWLDSSGAALRIALTLRGINIKVNGDELAEVLQRPISDVFAAAHAAQELAAEISASVVITLGAQGAVMAHHGKAYHAQPPDVSIRSAVGSGDSFLAGLVTGELPESLRRAAAAGTANALSVGGGRFELADFERILADTRLISL